MEGFSFGTQSKADNKLLNKTDDGITRLHTLSRARTSAPGIYTHTHIFIYTSHKQINRFNKELMITV